MEPTYTYNAVITKVVDGDTIDFLVDLGFNVKLAIRTRLYGIDAPEVRTQEGRDVRDLLRKLLPIGRPAVVRTFKDPTDKYGRWIAVIEANLGDDGMPSNVNDWLIRNGHASPYG